VPGEIRAGLSIVAVAHMDEVLSQALLAPEPLSAAGLYAEPAPDPDKNLSAPH